jgi:uncharacterized RDD family membrane protein YckC
MGKFHEEYTIKRALSFQISPFLFSNLLLAIGSIYFFPLFPPLTFFVLLFLEAHPFSVHSSYDDRVTYAPFNRISPVADPICDVPS